MRVAVATAKPKRRRNRPPAPVNTAAAAGARAVAETEALITTALPDQPHWRLRHLGVRPSVRRKGLAAAVLAPVLVRCDAEKTPAAAAVFSWANVRFLRGFGFEAGAELRTADDELPLWVLERQPLPR